MTPEMSSDLMRFRQMCSRRKNDTETTPCPSKDNLIWPTPWKRDVNNNPAHLPCILQSHVKCYLLSWAHGRGAVNSLSQVHNMGVTHRQYHASRMIISKRPINQSINQSTNQSINQSPTCTGRMNSLEGLPKMRRTEGMKATAVSRPRASIESSIRGNTRNTRMLIPTQWIVSISNTYTARHSNMEIYPLAYDMFSSVTQHTLLQFM